MLEMRFDGCDDDVRVRGDELEPRGRNAYPCIDDHTPVQDAIEDVDEDVAVSVSFETHVVSLP